MCQERMVFDIRQHSAETPLFVIMKSLMMNEFVLMMFSDNVMMLGNRVLIEHHCFTIRCQVPVSILHFRRCHATVIMCSEAMLKIVATG